MIKNEDCVILSEAKDYYGWKEVLNSRNKRDFEIPAEKAGSNGRSGRMFRTAGKRGFEQTVKKETPNRRTDVDLQRILRFAQDDTERNPSNEKHGKKPK